jgi:hypothetical protein
MPTRRRLYHLEFLRSELEIENEGDRVVLPNDWRLDRGETGRQGSATVNNRYNTAPRRLYEGTRFPISEHVA